MSKQIDPILTMAEIYGPGTVYAPRAHSCTSRWVTLDSVLMDYLTGNQQAVMGEMPLIASRGAVCPAGLELIVETGIKPAASVHTFCKEACALDLARQMISQGRRIVIQHAYPAGVLPTDAFWVELKLLGYLNNKANLGEMAAAEKIPRRCICDPSDVFQRFPRRPFPFVLKVATDLSTGGGEAVAVCRSETDLAAASRRFQGCGRLVVESCLEIKKNLCLNYAVMPNGNVRYLGHAMQEIAGGERYIGNWIELGAALCPALVEIGTNIARRGSALGYRGIVGIDFAILQDQQALVLDLNFRLNGCTAALLLAPCLHEKFGPAIVHLRSFSTKEGFEKMIAAARPAVQRGQLIPLNTFDPIAAGYDPAPAQMRALVLGNCEADVLAIENELAAEGLS